MQLLTKGLGQKVSICDGVKFTLLGVKNNRILIRIDAPRDIQVNRAEDFQRNKN